MRMKESCSLTFSLLLLLSKFMLLHGLEEEVISNHLVQFSQELILPSSLLGKPMEKLLDTV